MSAIAPVEPKHSLIVTMANRYGLEQTKFLATIEKTIFPADKKVSVEQAAAFLVVANQYELNPFIKEIYAFPGRNGGIVPIVSVDGWLTLINRQPQLDGIEFEDQVDDGKLLAVTCRIFRKDRSHPTEVTEYMNECVRNTDTWVKWPSRMLRHKALIQCARYAFGLAGIYDPDEAERIAEADAEPVQQIVQKTREKAEALKTRLRTVASPPAETEAIDAEIVTSEEVKAEVIDEKAELKKLRASIRGKFKALEWDEKRQEEYLDNKDLAAYSLDGLVQINEDLAALVVGRL